MKTKYNNYIQLGKFVKKKQRRRKWKGFEVHHLIAIRGEMDKQFAKKTRYIVFNISKFLN